MSSDNPYPHLKNFVPLPSDPNVKLTREQLDALFPPENRHFWNEMFELVMRKYNISGILPETLPQSKPDIEDES
jgi:hypothetical protein